MTKLQGALNRTCNPLVQVVKRYKGANSISEPDAPAVCIFISVINTHQKILRILKNLRLVTFHMVRHVSWGSILEWFMGRFRVRNVKKMKFIFLFNFWRTSSPLLVNIVLRIPSFSLKEPRMIAELWKCMFLCTTNAYLLTEAWFYQSKIYLTTWNSYQGDK